MKNLLLTAGLMLGIILNFASYCLGEYKLQEYAVVYGVGISILSIICSRQKYRLAGFLFLGTSSVFLLGRFLSSVVLLRNDYAMADWFIYGRIDQGLLSSALLACSTFLITFAAAYSIGVAGGPSKDISPSSASAEVTKHGPITVETYFQFACIAFLPFAIFRAWNDLEMWRTASYMSTYLTGNNGGWADKLGGIFPYAIFGYIVFSNRIKRTTPALFVGLAVSLCEALAGARGIPVAQSISLVWVYLSINNIRIRWAFVAGIFPVLFLLVDYIGVSRVGLPYDLLARLTNLPSVAADVLFSQGTTLLFVVATLSRLEHFDYMDAFTAIFANFLDYPRLILGQLQGVNSISHAETSFSLAHRIAYDISPDMYLSGFGLGGSVVAESLLFSVWFGPIFFGVIIGVSLRSAVSLAQNSRGFLFLLAATLPYVLLLARENSLYFLVPLMKAVLFLLVYRGVCWSREVAK